MTDGPSKVKWYYDLHGIKYPTKEQLEEMHNTICPFYDGKYGKGKIAFDQKFSITEEDGKKIAELYLAGYTDAEIGEQLNAPVKLIIQYRGKTGLNSMWKLMQAVTDEQKQTITEMNKAGKTDTEISHAIDLEIRVVSKMRRTLGLPANKHFGGPKNWNWDLAMEMYQDGCSDFQIGKAIGCSDNTVRVWRMRENLGKNNVSWGKADE